MSAQTKQPGPGEVVELENLQEETVPTRKRLAVLWATQLVEYVEKSSALQRFPKAHSSPSVVGCIESQHRALGAGIDADGAYESTFFTVRFNGGAIVRMKMLANEANGRPHWKIDGCSVEYPQNEWKHPQQPKAKKVLRLGPTEVEAILTLYKETPLAVLFVAALRKALLDNKKPEKVPAERWEWLKENSAEILAETEPIKNMHWGCHVQEDYNHSGATLVETVSGRAFLQGSQ